MDTTKIAIEPNNAGYLFVVRIARFLFRHLTGGKGMGAVHRLLCRFTSVETRRVKAQLTKDAVFYFDGSDSYWGYYLLEDRVYEPELHVSFQLLSQCQYALLDCGANFGYWSAILSGGLYGRRNVLAVEAQAETFAVLSLNAKANNDRFRCVYAAVTDQDGQWAQHLSGNTHAANSFAVSTSATELPTRSLASLIDELEPNIAIAIVVKLDIEGAELLALSGLHSAPLARDIVFLYEDHGGDMTCAPSVFLFAKGYRIVFFSDEGATSELFSVDEVRSKKTHPERGYNFMASLGQSELFKAVCARQLTYESQN